MLIADGLVTARCADASVLVITSLANHPNFLGFDVDPEVALSRARCRWGDDPGDETIPTVLEAMSVQCSSFKHTSSGFRTLQLSLNEEDFTALAPVRLPLIARMSEMIA